MTIVLFLIDTSVSMGQKTYQGTSMLDAARAAVEAFLKQRARDANARGDRYMLMSFEEFPRNVKAGWREGQAVFHEQLKNLKPKGLTTFGPSLGAALRFVNISRHTTLIDNYGNGRYPAYLEPVVIIAITDGGSLNDANSGVVNEVLFTKPTSMGNELTEEPFRWDQRLFSLILRLPGHAPKTKFAPGNNPLPADSGPIEQMCAAMGGRSYCVWSHKMLPYCVDSIVQKMQPGVMVRLERYGPPPTMIIPTVVILFVFDGLTNGHLENGPVNGNDPEELRSQLVTVFTKLAANRTSRTPPDANWPIPEAFWPEEANQALPPRKAHPVIYFRCETSDPLVCPDFPFDKFELEPCPLTNYILQRKQPNVCWQLFVADSGRVKGLGLPFGYLKAATALNAVNLCVMPYNYPVLLSLIGEVRGEGKSLKIGASWKMKFEKYLATVPHYYYTPLRKALTKINLTVMPDNLTGGGEQGYSHTIKLYLTRIKHNAKDESDSSCQAVTQALQQQTAAALAGNHQVTVIHRPITQPTMELPAIEKKENKRDQRSRTGSGKHEPKENSGTIGRDRFDRSPRVPAAMPTGPEYKGFQISITKPSNRIVIPSVAFRNPFEIDRERSLEQLLRMRTNLEQHLRDSLIPVLEGGRPGQRLRLQHADDLHNLPIGQMGNYQDYVKGQEARGMAPLREVEPQAIRIHAFGNPFKLDKKNMLIDEVGEGAMLGGANAASPSAGTGGASPIVRGKRGSSTLSSSSVSSLGSEGSRPPKRKPGPLSADFRMEWRARRRRRLSSISSNDDSGSERGSMEDDDDDRLSIASTSSSIVAEPRPEAITMEDGNRAIPTAVSIVPAAMKLKRTDDDDQRLRPEPDANQLKVPIVRNRSRGSSPVGRSGSPARKIRRMAAVNGDAVGSSNSSGGSTPKKLAKLTDSELNDRRLRLSCLIKRPITNGSENFCNWFSIGFSSPVGSAGLTNNGRSKGNRSKDLPQPCPLRGTTIQTATIGRFAGQGAGEVEAVIAESMRQLGGNDQEE